jgi:putative endonuclease
MYIVYILKSENFFKSYVGITDNIERRLKQHNAGNHFYTKRYVPWVVIYKEECKDRIEARKREKYFKSFAGRKFLRKNIFKN